MPTFDEIKERHQQLINDRNIQYNTELHPASNPIDKVWEVNGHFYMKVLPTGRDIEITRSQFDNLKEEMICLEIR